MCRVGKCAESVTSLSGTYEKKGYLDDFFAV